MTMKKNSVFEGVTIIDATLHESGPVATQMFAFMGATVIHINRPDDDASWHYLDFTIRNCNKKDITLNTKSPEGKALMWKLIESADVFIENFAPGAWERMGFSYEDVKAHNPEIVYVSLKGFPKGSRFEHCITYDPVACSTGGCAYLSGMEEGDPMLCGINIGDAGSSIVSATVLAGALLRKKVTGKGCHLETPMQVSVMSQSRRAFAEYYANDGKVRRAGNSYRGLEPTAPHNIYPAQGYDATGNYVMIACSADPESPDFENLCKAIGREDLLADPRYATPALRYENRHALDFEISKWTVGRRRSDIMRRLAIEYKVPCGSVNGIDDVYSDPFLTSGQSIFQEMIDPDIPETGRAYTPTLPLHMSNGGFTPVTCGVNGKANEEIYCGLLGLSKEELEQLKANKVI